MCWQDWYLTQTQSLNRFCLGGFSLKKRKLPSSARGLIPVVFFFTAADVIIFLLQFGKSLNEITQIGILSRYCGELSLVVFIFMIISDALQNGGPREKKKKRTKKRAVPRSHRRKAVQNSDAAEQALSVEFSEATVSEDSSDIRTSAEDAAEQAGEDGEKPKKKKRKPVDGKKLAAVLFSAAFGQILVRMCLTAYRYSADRLLSNTHDYTMAEAAVLGIFAAAAFFFRSRAAQSRERGSVTFTGLYAASGVAFAVYAAVIAVTAVLKLKIYPYLSWVYRFCLVYIAVMLAAGLVLSLIKRDVPGEMNYGIFIPFINRTEGETLADTLEKYTGLSLKSLWSIKLVGTALPGAVLGLALLLLMSTCVYKVEPYEEAVVYRFGAMNEISVKEGLHFKLPYPIDKAELYDVHRVKSVTVGYESTGGDDNLWNGTHASEEYKLLTGDGNELVSVNLKLNYRITDLTQYLKTASEPERIMTAFAYEAVLSHTAFTNLDTLMSVDRTGLSANVRDEINERLTEAKLGIAVDEVVLESIHPPVEIADVYQSVVSAAVKKTTLITNAEREAASTVTNAEKTAKTSVNDAAARQTKKVSEAQYDAAVFDAADEAYRAHPESFRLSKYLDTFVTAVKGKKMYVFTPSAESSMNDFIINRTNGSVTVVE